MHHWAWDTVMTLGGLRRGLFWCWPLGRGRTGAALTPPTTSRPATARQPLMRACLPTHKPPTAMGAHTALHCCALLACRLQPWRPEEHHDPHQASDAIPSTTADAQSQKDTQANSTGSGRPTPQGCCTLYALLVPRLEHQQPPLCRHSYVSYGCPDSSTNSHSLDCTRMCAMGVQTRAHTATPLTALVC